MHRGCAGWVYVEHRVRDRGACCLSAVPVASGGQGQAGLHNMGGANNLKALVVDAAHSAQGRELSMRSVSLPGLAHYL